MSQPSDDLISLINRGTLNNLRYFYQDIINELDPQNLNIKNRVENAIIASLYINGISPFDPGEQELFRTIAHETILSDTSNSPIVLLQNVFYKYFEHIIRRLNNPEDIRYIFQRHQQSESEDSDSSTFDIPARLLSSDGELNTNLQDPPRQASRDHSPETTLNDSVARDLFSDLEHGPAESVQGTSLLPSNLRHSISDLSAPTTPPNSETENQRRVRPRLFLPGRGPDDRLEALAALARPVDLTGPDISNIYVFRPDINERGRNYLETFLQIYEAQKNKGPIIDYEIKVEGEEGQDYSGIYRDVVNDMLNYWFPVLDFSPFYRMGHELRSPRLVEGLDYNKFGQLVGYLAMIKSSNPSIRGYPVNLGLNLDFGQPFWAFFSDPEDFNIETILAYYLQSLPPKMTGTLIARFAQNQKVTMENLSQYPFTETITRLVTNNCGTLDTLNKIIPKGQIGSFLYAYILYYPCEWAQADLVSELPDDEQLDGLEKIMANELEKGISEYEYLIVWLQLYVNWMIQSTPLLDFIEGLKTFSEKYRTISTTAKLKEALSGDNLNDSNIRPAIMQNLQITANDQQRQRIQTTFQSALDTLTYKEIRSLLKFWTGNNSVAGPLKIDTIGVTNRLPSASTCFNNLHLPIDLIGNSVELVRRLKLALDYGGAGTGLI